MSRIARHFAQLAAQGRRALIPFITAGDPEPSVTVPLMHALVRAGADLIELGVPFSDPMADGPAIQRASERALAHHVSLDAVLHLVAAFRQTDLETPVVLMGYLNPIEAMGAAVFAERAKHCGVDGVLIVDLPPEEAGTLHAALTEHEIDPIFLLAPTSTPERIRTITEHARGFVYYVSLKGVTGASHLDVAEVGRRVAEIRRHTTLPVGVGFGIHDAASAASVAAIADAVIVGSALVRRIEALADDPSRIADDCAAFLTGLRSAMDRAISGSRSK